MIACNIYGMTDDGRNKQRKHDTPPNYHMPLIKIIQW